MRALITGFDKFGGESINPSSLCVNSLPDNIDNIEIKKITLPTIFKDSSHVLEENIASFSPNIVICVGQAGGRSKITPERIAINIDDARIPDNIGNSPIDETIRKDGENAYFSTLPIKAIVDELNKNSIPSAISNTAGTFVCNHVMYEALYITSKKYQNIKAGFIHIPYIEEQVADKPNMPYMKKEDIIVALELIIKTAVIFYNREDTKVTGGLEH